MAHVVGLDLGTQSAKAIVYDDALRPRGAGRQALATRHPRAGWAEQDVATWAPAIGAAIAAALTEAGLAPSAVSGLAVTGQLDGLIATDAGGAPLGPCLPWLDRRAALPALDDDALLAITGQVADAQHLAAKARWWDRQGGPRAACFHQPVSYLVEQLTGARVIDRGLASTTMLYDLAAAAWSAPLLAAFELDAARLPALAHAADRAGPLDGRGAALTGLPRGIPVAVGTGDDFTTPLGIGLPPGALLSAIGTAEVVAARGPLALRDHGRLVEVHPYPADDGGFLENPGWSAGGAITWLGALTGLDAAALDQAAASVEPGAGGVAFVPALGGAMVPVWNPRARGAFVGLGPGHGPGHLARAIYEACAAAMIVVGDRLRALGIALDAIHLVGGGARADTWAGIRADASGLPVARWDDPDACPRGAAMLAIAARDGAALAEVTSLAPPPATWSTPDAGHADRYAEVRAQVLRAAAALVPVDEAHAPR